MSTSSFASTLSLQLQKATIWMVAVMVLGIGIIGGYLFFFHQSNPIPASVRSQLTFSPLTVSSRVKDFTVSDFALSSAEDASQILSYRIRTKDNISITVSEYPQPQQFSDIPEYRDRFLSNVAKQYETVQTANGILYLGRLERQQNKQLGVMLEKGLLVFFSPESELNSAVWRSLGDQLELQKITN